ncbi:acetyl-CoA carboxylase biotin carboxyl carrier protein subunit [Neolewinella persica]|uniref:acetyl-CoA carboxylase biotin carboxyl carrier protein subunit n=1 Tax=Neolewinella persica TaxID=70998 RepID=UPI0003785047|nr:acetyl-CoA carboxylase biotin carboxyl carrier protein subunit [Neolewinella persica]
MPKYQVTIADREYPAPEEALNALDLIATGEGTHHLLHDGKSYVVEVLRTDADAKTMSLRVNGREHHLQLADKTDQLVKKLGFSAVSAIKSLNAIAPMPGLVLDIMVAVGDTVTDGTPLLILEAMKMENVLKSEGDGVVKSISVKKGDAVEKRQLLIELE